MYMYTCTLTYQSMFAHVHKRNSSYCTSTSNWHEGVTSEGVASEGVTIEGVGVEYLVG